jgi:serine/threonine protein kinase
MAVVAVSGADTTALAAQYGGRWNERAVHWHGDRGVLAKATMFALALQRNAPQAFIAIAAESLTIVEDLDQLVARAIASLGSGDRDIVIDDTVAGALDARFTAIRMSGGWRLKSPRPKAELRVDAALALSKVGVAFVDRLTEAQFRDWYTLTAPPFVRAGMLMTVVGWVMMLVWAMFNALDNELPAIVRFIGIGMSPSALCLVISLWRPARRWMAVTAAVANMLTAGLVLVVGFAVLPPPGPATHGVIFLTYFAFVVLRLDLRQALWSSLPFLIVYWLLLLAPHAHLYRNADRNAFTLALGIVPVVTAFVTATLIGAGLSRTSRRGFRDEHAAEAARRSASEDRVRAEQLERNAATRELATVGTELRRQLAERSRDLAHIAALMSKAKAPPRLIAGDLVDERYRVARAVGEGGMGRVYEIERLADGKRLALKVLVKVADAAALARFAREAQIAARLEHPNVVAAIDLGLLRSGAPFIVMELVAGASLAEFRDRYGDVSWALRLLAQVAEALAAMHARSIVHRDLKPANVLVTDSCVKVADFGLSRIADENGVAASLTRSGVLMGTPWYMAPELAHGARAAQPPSDVFSLGVLAYELLARRLPYDSPPVFTPPDRSPPPLSGVVPELARLIDDCLRIRPEERPSAVELAHCLRALVAGLGMPPRTEVPRAERVQPPTTAAPGPETHPSAIGPAGDVSQERHKIAVSADASAGPAESVLESLELGRWGLRFSAPHTEQRFAAHGARSSVVQIRIIMLATIVVWTMSVIWTAVQWREMLASMLSCALAAMLPVSLCLAVSMRPAWRSWVPSAAILANVMNGTMAILICYTTTRSPLVATHVCVWFCYFGMVGLRLRFARGLLATMPFLLLYQIILVVGYCTDRLERHLLISETVVIWVNFVSALLAAGVFARVLRLGFRQERTSAIEHEVASNEHERVERLEREAVARQVDMIGIEIRRHVAERSRSLVETLAHMRNAPAPPPTSLAPRDIVEGRYRIEHLLGAGSMGRVYQVVRLADAQPLALKVMSHAVPEASLPRFVREIAIAAQFDHPNIVTVVDLGTLRCGAPFFVMHLIDGPSLATIKERYGDAAWALPILAHVANALVTLHAHGIVHRDLKPANILLSSGTAKVSDFGIARLYTYDETADMLTRTGEFLGTPAYMAPELAQNIRSVGTSADIFSFGVIAYEVLTGQLPYRVPFAFAHPHSMQGPEFLPLANCRPDLTPEVAALIDACLCSEPGQRPAADNLTSALRAASQGPSARDRDEAPSHRRS